MKFLLFLTVCLAFICHEAQAQTVPLGANAIEITTSLTDSTLFESVQSYLEEAGFDIDLADAAGGTITTEYKVVSEFKAIKEPIQIRILATLEGGIVLFRGETKTAQTVNKPEGESVSNSAGNANGAFAFMNEVVTKYAKTLDLAEVDYNVL